MPRQRRRTSASGQVQSSSPFASDLHTTSFFCNYRWFPNVLKILCGDLPFRSRGGQTWLIDKVASQHYKILPLIERHHQARLVCGNYRQG